MRRARILLVAALLAALVAGPRPLQAGPARVRAVGPVEITVSDLDRSVKFFTEVLTFRVLSRTEFQGEAYERLEGVFGAHVRQATLALGDEQIQLTEYLAPRGKGRPETQRSNDGWFQHVAIIVSDMDAAYRRLRDHQVEHASSSPQTLPAWNPNAGGISAFYFRDPDGHALEILHFPSGKGDPKWQRKDRLFLGIDHTAIVVRDTEKSIGFYRDLLGMTVAGGAENWGTEQEHLNNVFGAHLRITSLRAAGGGPAIELLEYLAPRDGRPYPPDAHPNDLIHWQTELVTEDVAGAADALRAARVPMISSGVVTLTRAPASPRALIVRDPDGHAMEVIQP